MNKLYSIPARRENIGSAYLVYQGSGSGDPITLGRPRDDEFWLIAYGISASTNAYVPGAPYSDNRASSLLVVHHSGVSGFQSIFLAMAKAVPGQSWANNFYLNLDSTTNLRWAVMLMRRTGEFVGNVHWSVRQSLSAVSTSTMTPPGGLSQHGGLWFSAGYCSTAGTLSSAGPGWTTRSQDYISMGIAPVAAGSMQKPGALVYTATTSLYAATASVYLR